MPTGRQPPKSPFVTFEEAELNTLRQGQALSAGEKLRWLEEAENLTITIQWNRARQGLPVDAQYRDLLPSMVAEEPAPYRSNSSASSQI
jgi:hypothetical protein